MEKRVRIEVRGGVAEVTGCDEGVVVEILDHDNLPLNSVWADIYEGPIPWEGGK